MTKINKSIIIALGFINIIHYLIKWLQKIFKIIVLKKNVTYGKFNYCKNCFNNSFYRKQASDSKFKDSKAVLKKA